MSCETTDTVVIGAGVIGLAIARQLALSGREVLVLEANETFGQETSSRNSGVIHAGIYYPPASLKAQCCVQGNQLLYTYCAERNIPHLRCGKLIVASSEDQQSRLQTLQKNAINTGVDDLEWLDEAGIAKLEPEIQATAALYSPSSGIVDPHELMLSLVADLESAGGTLVTRSKVLGGKPGSGGIELTVDSGGKSALQAASVINSAGHGAVKIAGNISGFKSHFIPQVYPVRGHYYQYSGKLPFSRLIYPLPQDRGLGIHATIDLAGQWRFGPDAEYCDGLDYHFDESGRASFIRAIQTWYPGLDEERLHPGYVGIRPALREPGAEFTDFVISTPKDHGVDGLVNLFGIESPGLTSCLALAKLVCSKFEPG